MTARLRLRPDLPVCWESPDTLRIGFERAHARVVAPTAGQQRLLGVLRTGIAESELPNAARRAGATPREARELLAAVAPACLPQPPRGPGGAGGPGGRPPPATRIRVLDAGRPVPGFAAALAHGLGDSAVWAPQAESPDAPDAHGELIVGIERFLEPLERAQRWLITGTPHLLVRFTDTCVLVGPIVAPQGAPCHTCAVLPVLQDDPAAAVLAAQLVETVPASETAEVGVLAAALAVQLIGAWRRGEPHVGRTCSRVEVAGGRVAGTVERAEVRPHPECACGALRPGRPPR